MTGNPMITAAKMICKSIDALTREIYMLRKDVAEKDILEDNVLKKDIPEETEIYCVGERIPQGGIRAI